MADEKKKTSSGAKRQILDSPKPPVQDFPEEQEEKPPGKDKRGEKPFPLVCLGSSAGGLKSQEAFLSGLPEKSGMAFIFLTHTAPDQTSLLPEILQRKSKIPVLIIEEGMHPEPNRAYLPPSNKDVVIDAGEFHLRDRRRRDGLHMPIDIFLDSLAHEFEEMAGCAILSGTGTDGTMGLRLIKEKAGVVLAETESSAQHYGMPRSAIETGLVDFVLEPGRMPVQLIDYFEHLGSLRVREREKTPKSGKVMETVEKVTGILAKQTGHDFSLYKKSTLLRRIERRMSVTGCREVAEYLRYLYRERHEAELLLQDLLIGVTEFFRDQEVFSFLKEHILTDMFSRLDSEESLRVWVPGCATGEEVYSVAILLREYIEEHNLKNDIQIFGTDIDKHAIEKARDGVYLQNIAKKLSTGRLQRFFHHEGDRYRVKKEIREPVIFAEQDILRDPPFTRLDILLCRNVLIYLESEAQNRLIPLFNYSLKPQGVLVLGTSESPGRHSNLFKSIHKKYSIYQKQEFANGTRPEIQFPVVERKLKTGGEAGISSLDYVQRNTHSGLAQAMDRLLLDGHTPSCVVVGKSGEILHIHGRTGKYLEFSSGKPELRVMSLAREGLRFPLSSALRRASSTNKEIRQERVRIKTNHEFQEINLRVIPLSQPPALKDTLMIIFEEAPKETPSEKKSKRKDADKDKGDDAIRRNIELENEMSRLREDYRSALEELETSNEELKSVNEEMLSSNEELQSTNEELDSSREELQSLNEELSTVNAQLQRKMEELSESYTAVTDALNSTRIALLFLDNDLEIKRFTPEAGSLINLIGTDIGRPITHISHNLEIEDLPAKVRQVHERLSPIVEDIRTRDGHWYRMSIRIDRTGENVISGTVLTFINIDAQKEAQAESARLKEKEVQAVKRFSESIVDTVRESLLVLDKNLRVLTANRRFYQTFQVSPEEEDGKSLFELGDGQWNIPELRELLDEILTEGAPFEDYLVEHRFPKIGYKRMLLNAHMLEEDENGSGRILLAIEDITDRKPSEKRNQ